jgi:predicted enzyme related to lactoylglutathione lyase
MCRFQIHRRCTVVIQRAFPPRNAHTPFVAGLQSGKTPLWMRCDQIVSIKDREIQKFLCDLHTDRVLPHVLWTCSAIAVAIKTGNRIATTTFQFPSQNIRRHTQLDVIIGGNFPEEKRMPIGAKYVHTNLIARDWKSLVRFYCDVFGCEPKGPERDLSAAWLDRVNSVPNARLCGVHLRLPGYNADGPTLEIFSYDQLIERGLPRANECGFGHIAFAVENVDEALQAVIAAGGGAVGEIATAEVDGVGVIRLVARDPEGNIVELQKWS